MANGLAYLQGRLLGEHPGNHPPGVCLSEQWTVLSQDRRTLGDGFNISVVRPHGTAVCVADRA
jgi:hypothetical protein